MAIRKIALLKLNLYKINNTLKSKRLPPKSKNMKDVFTGVMSLLTVSLWYFSVLVFHSYVGLWAVTVLLGKVVW